MPPWGEIPLHRRRGEMMKPAADTKTVLRYGPDDSLPAKRRKRVVRTLSLLAVATVGLILFILVMGDLRRHERAFALAEAYIAEVSQRVGQQHALPLNLAFRVVENLGESPAARPKLEWLTRYEALLLRRSDRRVLAAQTRPILRRLMTDGRVVVFFEKGVFSSDWISLDVFDRFITAQTEDFERFERREAAENASVEEPPP